ncbi:MAG: cellulase family glycosylhydrolase [Acidimicrobiales bacterium]
MTRKAILLAVVCVLLASCSTPKSHPGAQTTAKPVLSPTRSSNPEVGKVATSYVGHFGRWMTESDGQVVILHGLNMVYKRPPYEPASAGFGTAAAQTLEADGFDVVRVGVIYSALEPKPGIFSSSYINSIAATVDTLGSHGVYSLLDFHQDQMSTAFGGEGFPAWSVETNGLAERRYIFPLGYTQSPAVQTAFDNFWSNRPGPGGIGLQLFFAGAWKYAAQRFATNKWVVGYDLFNEPWPAHATTAELGDFYSRVIAGIRQVDTQHLIFYEPYVTFDFGTPTALGDFADPGLGMSFHDYCLSNAATDPLGCAKSEEQVITNALARSTATGNTLILSEFGATSNLTDLSRVVTDADTDLISWIEWSYCGCGDPTGTIPPSIEGLASDPGVAGTGSNVDQAKLAVLAEPYPRLVSGTPTSYSFDQSDRVMTLSYSTVSPGGKPFGAGACTAIVVPPSQYPGGYTSTVFGAQVTSSADAGMMTLSQTSAASTTVRVEIRPSTGRSTTTPALGPLSSCS